MRPPSKNLDTPRPVRLKSFRMSHSNQNHARLRVAMVSRRVHPAHGPGGLERHVFELVTELAARDVAVDLYSEAPADRSRLARADHLLSSVSTVSPHWVRGGWLPVGTRKGTVVVDRVTNYFIWSQRVARRLLNQAWSGAQIVHVHGLAGWGLARAARRGRLAAPLGRCRPRSLMRSRPTPGRPGCSRTNTCHHPWPRGVPLSCATQTLGLSPFSPRYENRGGEQRCRRHDRPVTL